MMNILTYHFNDQGADHWDEIDFNQIPKDAVIWIDIEGSHSKALLELAEPIVQLSPQLMVISGSKASDFSQFIEEAIFLDEQDDFSDNIADPRIEVFPQMEPALFYLLKNLTEYETVPAKKCFIITFGKQQILHENIRNLRNN